MVNIRVKRMAMNLQVTLIFFEKLMKVSCLINIVQNRGSLHCTCIVREDGSRNSAIFLQRKAGVNQ